MFRKLIITAAVIVMAGCSAIKNEQTTKNVHNKVHDYCQTDFNGDRLQLNENLKQYVSWEEESGWDHFTVIEGFKIDSIKIADASATVVVEYAVVGSVNDSLLLNPQPKQEVITFNLSKTGSGWRINSPLIPPHVSLQKTKELISTNQL